MAKERFELSDGVKDLLSGMGKLSAEMKDNSAKAMEYAQSMDKLAKQNTELTKLNEALSTSFSKVSNALNKASSGNDLTKYIKSQENMVKSINRTYRQYSIQSDTIKKNQLAEELYKQVNALRAVTDSVDLSNLVGNFEEVKKAISSVGSYVKSEFSVSAFKEINETIEVLEQAGLKIKNVFSTLDKGSKFYDIDRELRETKEQLDLINNTDISELTGKLKKLGEIAEEEFNTFLNLYNISGRSYKFYDIFEEIRSGAITSQQAIERVKNEFEYLLVEAKSSGNQNYDVLNSSTIREMVENISTLRIKVDEIMTRVSNVHGDTTGIKIFDEEQFNRLLILFEKIESSLSSMKAMFVDVGDGEEFSPLLKMIDNVQSSIKELSISVNGIGLNMNIDVGSDKELETQFQDKISKALIAYQRLFDHIKMSGVGGSVINDAFFNFDLNQFDTTIGKVKGLQQFIAKAREDAKALYGGQDVLKQDTDVKFWNQASAALAQMSIVEKQIKDSADTSSLESLFGGKTDLTEVTTQLGLIVTKLEEISANALEFKNIFKEGFNVTASIEEIEKLTSRVKELEDELSKVKVSSTSPVETNISSGNSDKINNESVDAGYISDTKNNIIKWYRTVNDTITGLFSKGRTGSFFSDNLELSRGYADYNAKTYEAAIKLTDKLLELNGKGKANWDSLSYLGFGTDEDSKEIIELANQFQKIYGNINNLKKDGDSLFGSNSFFAISSEAKKGIESAKSIEDVVEQFKQIQQLSKMGLVPNSLPDFDLTDENDVKRLENILQDFYNIEKVVKRIKEINMDVNNLYGMTLPEEYYNNHVNANDDSARLTTNRMTDKASKAGYDAVLFKDIHDSAKEETGRIVSSILSVINNSIVDKVNVLSNDEIDKRLGNDFLEHIVQNTDEFQNNIQKSLREVLTSYMGAGEDISKEIDNIIKNVMSGYKGHIAEELHTEVNSFDDLLDRISREITKSTIDEYIPGKSITQEFKAQMTETYEEIVRGINQSMQSSTTPIEDTFQGDKIQETVSVADKLEEEIQEITVATDKAGKALEEYKEKWKVLKQVGDVGDDKYSATFEKNAGQIESVIWKAKRDADGNVLFDSNGEKEYEMLSVTISNYQKLESVIVNADNELRKLEDRRQNLLKQNPTASTSGLDAQIAYQKNYISLLEQTVKHISQADEYLLEEQQIIEARNKAEKEYQLTKGSKQDESVAKDYQKRNDTITKANRLLNTQEKTVEHIAKTYDKALNPDLEKSVNNPNDLAELAQKKSEIQTLINQLKNAPRDASNEQEYLRLEKLIAEYKDLADYKKKANNPTKQELGGQKLETLVAQTVAEYDKLIIRAEKYGDATKGIVEKLKQQRDLLAQTDSNGKYTANANDFYSARDVLKVQKADFGVFEASEKAIKIREKELEAVRKLSAEKQKLQEKDRQSTVDSALKDQLSAWKDIQNIREKIAKTTNEEELSILNQQKKNAQQQYLSAEKVLKANVDLYDNEARLKQLEDVRLETNRKLVAYGETQVKAIGNLVKNEQAHLDKLRPSDGNRSVNFEKAVQEYNKAIIALREFHATLDSSTPLTKEQSAKYDELASSLQEARVEMEKFSAAEKGSTEGSRWKEIDKITKYLEKNTRISKIAKQQLEDLVNTLKNVSGVNVDNIHLQFNKIAEAERAAGREGKRFWDIITDKAVYGAAAQLASYYLSLTDFIRYGKQMVDTVIEIDTALTELRKVSDATEQRLTENFKNSAKTAKDLGATVSDVISATADWARMGYNVDDAEELARISTLYKNVGDGIEIEEANNSLISTLQGFQLTADDAESVIDKFNEVANNFAIDSAGIGEALQRSAASFNAANTDLSKSIALITATNEVVQNPEVVGTLWKTMSARIRGAKTELEELGEETDEYTETTSKLRDLVKGLTGFDIMADEDTFKDIYEIILGIGQEWENLTDVEQASLGEALAGKRSANALYAVLGNLDTLEDVYKTAEKSAGSAMREQENYEKSIQYSLERLTASAQEWSAALVDSGVIKWFVDLANAIVEVSTAITPLGTLALGGGLFAGIKNVGEGKMYPFIVLNSQQQYVFFRIRKFSYCQ